MLPDIFNLVVQSNVFPLQKDPKRKIWTLYDPRSNDIYKFAISDDNVYDHIIIHALNRQYAIINHSFLSDINSRCRDGLRTAVQKCLESCDPKGKRVATILLRSLG